MVPTVGSDAKILSAFPYKFAPTLIDVYIYIYIYREREREWESYNPVLKLELYLIQTIGVGATWWYSPLKLEHYIN